MSNNLEHLRDLVLEAAVNNLAVADFKEISEEYSDEDNAISILDFKIDRDVALINVIDYVLKHGSFLRLHLLAEKSNNVLNRSKIDLI